MFYSQNRNIRLRLGLKLALGLTDQPIALLPQELGPKPHNWFCPTVQVLYITFSRLISRINRQSPSSLLLNDYTISRKC